MVFLLMVYIHLAFIFDWKLFLFSFLVPSNTGPWPAVMDSQQHHERHHFLCVKHAQDLPDRAALTKAGSHTAEISEITGRVCSMCPQCGMCRALHRSCELFTILALFIALLLCSPSPMSPHLP